MDAVASTSEKAMKPIEMSGYKYMGIFELDNLMEKEITESSKEEWLRRLELILKSK